LNIEFVKSPNYSKGRNGKKIIAICNHITAGQFPGCQNWLCNPKAKASSNYLITRTGKIIQLVKDEDTAWANGGVNKPSWTLYDGTNPNRYTISIEHEGYGSNGGDGNLTEQQYQATLCLHRQLINKWNIPIDRNHIIGHFEIDKINRPNCPGKAFPWDRLMKDLTSGVIDDMLEKWQEDMGKNAVKNLAKMGLLNSPEYWEKKLGEKTENWIFFEMIKKLAEKIK
jgi:N-acetylmuramoyl-L-alanine amidase